MTQISELVSRLNTIPAGQEGWSDFEVVCTEILTFLFVPPLSVPKTQPRSYSGIDRMDAVFPNRQDIGDNVWAKIYRELDARLILFEFKNYDKTDVGKTEVNQTRNYLTKAMGRLAVICSNKLPVHQAHIKRNSIFSEEKKVILFITKDKLEEMLYIKERGDDPGDLIMDEIEWFYLQHE
ncbi:hypothetical protein [Desulfoluna spongiiphila]|uniref:hypothetical protein n=1 Tax=Desulfoluna spongiiphila TaxID=419481 RepID=UPI00125488AA|nr:hypothetical protein [Desulfoluna spongiiphila]VVS94667.1 hypothetical protein DBB_42390 [Desulfoluna spongiiphila]